eukprot:TRINITY_DN9189_c0_g1_i1.p1 TRINITY_DN9189_c0_g1~~TRINITY_DN9189_c0_g1_i1.p1  ORF type:complete len:577 (+),score=143.90 TRINITY_DN9189_c0_g1_i1:84-1733(+)
MGLNGSRVPSPDQPPPLPSPQGQQRERRRRRRNRHRDTPREDVPSPAQSPRSHSPHSSGDPFEDHQSNPARGTRRPGGGPVSSYFSSPGDSRIAEATTEGHCVFFESIEGESVALVFVRPGCLERIVGDEWRGVVHGIAIADSDVSSGLKLVDYAGRDIVVPAEEDQELLRLLSHAASLAVQAHVPHSLGAYLVPVDPRPLPVTAPPPAAPPAPPETREDYMLWTAATPLPPGTAQRGPNSRGASPPASAPPSPRTATSSLTAAQARGDSVQWHHGGNEGPRVLLLHLWGRMELYAAYSEGGTPEWLLSVRSIDFDRTSGGPVLRLAHAGGLRSEPLRVETWQRDLGLIGRLADKAGVRHSLWWRIARPSVQSDNAAGSDRWECPACTYSNPAGGVCRMCGAIRPEPAAGLDGDGENEPSDDELEELASFRRPPCGFSQHGSATSRPCSRLSLSASSARHSPQGAVNPLTAAGRQSPGAQSTPQLLRASSGSQLADCPPGRECAACQRRQRSTVLMPCKHLCVCSACASALRHCPECRGPVTHHLEVWV